MKNEIITFVHTVYHESHVKRKKNGVILSRGRLVVRLHWEKDISIKK